jgi:hypothetical protein
MPKAKDNANLVRLMSVKEMDSKVGLKYAYTDFKELNLRIQGKSKETASKNPTLALVNDEGKRYRVGIGPLYNAMIAADCKALIEVEGYINYDTSIPFNLNAEEGEYSVTNP